MVAMLFLRCYLISRPFFSSNETNPSSNETYFTLKLK